MSEPESLLREKTGAANISIFLYSILLIAVACGLLFGLIHLGEKVGVHAPAEPWWFVLGTRLIETLMGVGALGLLFEFLLRRQLVAEILEKLKLLFAIDREFAGRLRTDDKKLLVQNTLKAHLGDDDFGRAIYMNLIDRYFLTGRSLTRYNLDATISLSDLDHDVVITGAGHAAKQVTLSKQHYYGLYLKMDYQTRFSVDHSVVGAILTEEPKELNSWFDNNKCMFRHFFLLPDNQRADLISLLTAGQSDSKELLRRFFNLTIRIGVSERVIPVDQFNLKPDSRESLEIFLNQEALLQAQRQLSEEEINDPEGVLHSIELHTYIPKEARLYPYLIRDPHKNPNFKFLYSAASGINRVIPLVNFSGDAANAVRANHFDKDRYANVVTGTGKDVWVFPNSSVAFRWS